LDPSALPAASWLLVTVAAVLGVGLGVWLGRRSSRDLRERAHDLEERLQIAEEDMTRYRAQVSEHFADTSKLLRDLTLQYRNVYEHLAEGARTLCPDGATLLAPSLAEAALPADHGAEPATGETAPLDLAIQASRPWTPNAPADEDGGLGPLLDEPLETTDAASSEPSPNRPS
jgi:uncharacterized membrane-anchored protein YhcB (DUF1043 family)